MNNTDLSENIEKQNQEPIDLEALTEKLKKEAKEFLHLSKTYKQNKYMNNDKEGYLLSKIWLRKWKQYTDYKTLKDQNEVYRFRTIQKTYTIRPELFPGPIDNNVLLVNQDNYYHDNNSEDIENQVVRHDMDQNNELRIVNEEIWNFFHKRYGGGPAVLKPLIEEDNKFSRRKVFEVYYGKYQLLILPDRKSILDKTNVNEIELPDVKILYISRTKSLKDMKQKIVNVAVREVFRNNNFAAENIANGQIDHQNIRLWRFSGALSKEDILQNFSKEAENLRAGKLINPEGLTYCEYTSDVKLSDFDVEDSDTLIVEVNLQPVSVSASSTPTAALNGTAAEDKPETQTQTQSSLKKEESWLFDVPVIPMKKGKCDWCGTIKLLKIFCICKEVWYCCEICKTRDTNYHENHCKKKFEIEDSDVKMNSKSRKGLVGLQNLGNTCFMNTSLQCIANCYELSQYFLTDIYKKDINTDNPLGTQGALARSYANLLKELYYGESNYYSPRHFKKAIATFQSMFTGYQQHDTQEFLNFLLDGLHEDLNRVIKKPFIEKDESSKDDLVKSHEQWISFQRRNQSSIVDLLYGQFKSTITCPCSNISTTFDPYLTVSLPLANRVQPYEVTCFFIFYDLSITPIQINLMFNTKTNIMALRNKIAKIMNFNPFSFLIAKMDQKGYIEYLCTSKQPIIKPSTHQHSNQKAYFLFQINPETFEKFSKEYNVTNFTNKDYKNMMDYLEKNNDRNKLYFEEGHEEDENCKTTETECYYSTSNYMVRNTQEKAIIKYSIDNNYGLSEDFMTCQIYMFGVTNNDDSAGVLQRARLIFPRMITISKSWTTEQIYKFIFNYFYPHIKKQLLEYLAGTHHVAELSPEIINDEEKLFQHFYSNYDSSPESDDAEYFTKKKLPFRLYMNTFYHSKCKNNVFTGKEMIGHSLEGYTLFPISDTPLEEFVSRIPSNNNGKTVDNTFLFMNDNTRFYSNLTNRDFYFQAVWNRDYTSGVKKLNDKVDFDFKITKKFKNSIDLDECFRQFCKEEVLEEGNEWFCSACKQHVKASVHMQLYTPAPVMIIHLKRFKANNKIDTLVEFPINDLDMSRYIIGPNKYDNYLYDLFAVAHHYGGMGGGHYVASAKNHFDGKWYNFNDSSVSPEKEEDIVNSSAYLLFYKRKDIKDTVNLDEIFNKNFIEYIPATTNPEN